MKYTTADNILPRELVEEIQKYIQGQYLYIPKENGTRESWGASSGIKENLRKRNEEILCLYRKGNSVTELAEKYYLSVSAIKKVVYGV